LTVDVDTLYYDPPGEEYWTEMTLSDPLGQDRIRWLWFQGILNMDDLEIVRNAPPAIVCDTVVRGSPTTCSIRQEVAQTLDSATAVTDWKFESVLLGGRLAQVDGPDWAASWSGKAVQSGDVEAIGWSEGNQIPLHGTLVVNDREGSEWEWTTLDWNFHDGTGMVGCLIPHWNKFGPSDSTTLGVNLRASSCYPNSVEPPVVDTTGPAGFVGAEVPSGGPNGGLWYVASAQYSMDRGSVINPSILAGYEPDTLGKSDSNQCPDSLRTGPKKAAVVNFYQYNTVCQTLSLQPLYDGIYRHEGFGTGGQDNGHEAQRRFGALNPANYPAAAAERSVATDSASLDDRVRFEVDKVDVVITEKSDPNHILVNGNFSESVYAQSPNGHYNQRTVDDAN